MQRFDWWRCRNDFIQCFHDSCNHVIFLPIPLLISTVAKGKSNRILQTNNWEHCIARHCVHICPLIFCINRRPTQRRKRWDQNITYKYKCCTVARTGKNHPPIRSHPTSSRIMIPQKHCLRILVFCSHQPSPPTETVQWRFPPSMQVFQADCFQSNLFNPTLFMGPEDNKYINHNQIRPIPPWCKPIAWQHRYFPMARRKKTPPNRIHIFRLTQTCGCRKNPGNERSCSTFTQLHTVFRTSYKIKKIR